MRRKVWFEYDDLGSQTLGYPQVMSSLDGQRMAALGVRLSRRLYNFPHVKMNGNIEFKPVAMLSEASSTGREYHYGGGDSVGLEFEAKRYFWLPSFFDVNGGTLIFTRDMPVEDARRVNLTLQFGPGVRLPLKGRNSLKFGVWFFHFSNASTAPRNPGFDGFMVYLGYVFNRTRREEN